MEWVLKCIDQLASTLAGKLKELEDHDLLDQILKELSKHASTDHIFRSTINNHDIYRSLEKEDENIKSMQNRALANSIVDVGELVSSCQAIKDVLDTFYVSYTCFPNYSFISFQVGLTLLVERNTRDILKVCHLNWSTSNDSHS